MKKKEIMRWAILVVAVALLTMGFFSYGRTDLWTAAARICMNCIGLG